MVNPSDRNITIVVHSTLRATLRDGSTNWDEAGIVFKFTDPKELFTLPGEDLPSLVPAVSEPDRELVRSLRQNRSLAQILAVVDDLDGHQTFLAIKAGASGVLNVRLPRVKQMHAVLSMCATTVLLPAGRSWPSPATDTTGVAATQSVKGNSTGADAEDDEKLTRMLCGGSSISSIAARFYTSERSMYRRIRRLYQTMGVSGRSELRSLAADQ